MIISFEINNVWQDSWDSLSMTENAIFCSWIIVRKKEGCKKLSDKTSFSNLKGFFLIRGKVKKTWLQRVGTAEHQ